MLALIFGLVVAPAPAEAAYNRSTPTLEIDAIYRHALDRPRSSSDTHHLDQLRSKGCSWGVNRAAFVITNSPEAAARWRTSQNLAGMLYWALLNRNPDPGGLTHYTNMITSRGLRYASLDMMASPEYHNRVSALCGTSSTRSAKVLSPSSAKAFVRDNLANRIAGNITSCNATLTADGIYQAVQTRNKLIEWHQNLVDRLSYFMNNPDCQDAEQYLAVAKGILGNADAGYSQFVYMYLGGYKVTISHVGWLRVLRYGNPQNYHEKVIYD